MDKNEALMLQEKATDIRALALKMFQKIGKGLVLRIKMRGRGKHVDARMPRQPDLTQRGLQTVAAMICFRKDVRMKIDVHGRAPLFFGLRTAGTACAGRAAGTA